MHPPSPHNPQFYSGAGAFPGTPRPQAPAGPPIGSHNQFTPLQVAVTAAPTTGVWLWVRIFTALLPFVWQVTKKLVSAKKNHVTQEFYSAAQTAAKRQSDRETLQQHPTSTTSPPCPSPGAPAPTTASQHTPPKQKAPSTGGTPGSASKRRNRKLAVSFEAAKVSE